MKSVWSNTYSALDCVPPQSNSYSKVWNVGRLFRNVISGSKNGAVERLCRGQERENIKMKYCGGLYKRKLIAPCLSEEPKEKRARIWGQRFEFHIVSASLRHVNTDTTESKIREAHGVCLKGDTIGLHLWETSWSLYCHGWWWGDWKQYTGGIWLSIGGSQLYEEHVLDWKMVWKEI